MPIPPITTPFQRKVYEAVCRIPEGRVTTYAALADSISCNSAQAVGQALKNNPYAPTVPCHRVIASNLKIGGFKGRSSGKAIRKKFALLKSEGVIFISGKLTEPDRLIKLPAIAEDSE